MGKITKLTPHLANMIAAGEVVERPSSVVKELVENAIDANAKSIQVILLEGGLKSICVIDDGDGMQEEDVRMAFVPHATSKIKTEYDLKRILSLGFRGEAIASIAAVSTMQIISSEDGTSGYQVTYKAGMKTSEGIISSNKGTMVTVKDLFFNTPARLKYLKPAKNELASISYFMDRIALAHTDIRFTLINDDRVYLQTSASSKEVNLMGEVYGLDVASKLLTSSFVLEGASVNLILVKPEIYRSNKLEITFIVNGRFVKNHNLTNAVMEGYHTYLPIGKYPIAIIYISIDPLLIDVNVHPSKTEIKISIEEILVDRLKVEIEKCLKEVSLIPERKIREDKGYQKENIFTIPRVENKLAEEPVAFIKQEEPVDRIEKKVEEPSLNRLPYLEYVGQAFGTYLIFQNEQGLYLVDQHAAAERINYEKYYQILGKENQPVSELLIPVVLTFTKSEMLFLEKHLSELERLGFILEPISLTDYAIRQVPLWSMDNPQDIIREAFQIFLEEKKISVIDFRDKIAKSISCKASIKANHALNRMEIDSLMKRLGECENPFTCPHGRPSIIKFSASELEKMFERIQS